MPLVVERRAVLPGRGENWRENGSVKLAPEGAVVGLGRGGGRKSFPKKGLYQVNRKRSAQVLNLRAVKKT